MKKALVSWAIALIFLIHGLEAFAGQPLSTEGLMVSNLGAPKQWKDKGWDRMTVTAPGFMSKTDTLQIPGYLLNIWFKEIAHNDKKYVVENIAPNGKSLLGKDGHAPADALWSVYQDGDRMVVVSMLDTAKFCEDGPNDINSTQIHSTCPIRVTVVQGLTVKNADYPGGCFLDSSFDSAPGKPRYGPDPAINASLTRYDRQAGIVELIAIRDNFSLPVCIKRLKVP